MNSSGTVTATNSFGTAGLVSRREASTSVFYSFDSEGNVAQRSNASGNVLSNHLFSAHGSILTGSLTDPFGYKAQVGYYTDNETGLQLLAHRFYDPSTGRFLTRDPICYDGGMNLYSYVTNNPVNFLDPTGTQVRSDRNFRPGDVPKRPASTPAVPRQPSNDVYRNALQKIASATGSGLDPNWKMLPGDKSYDGAIRGLSDMGFKPFFNPNPDHWGGADFEGQIEGNWYHVTVGYPPGLAFNLRSFQMPTNNCPPSFVTAHYEPSKPSSPSHVIDYLMSRVP